MNDDVEMASLPFSYEPRQFRGFSQEKILWGEFSNSQSMEGLICHSSAEVVGRF